MAGTKKTDYVLKKKAYNRQIPNPAELREIYQVLFKKRNVQFCFIGEKIKKGVQTPWISIEVAYGINLIGVFDFARMSELGAGLSEGSEFNGTEDTIPIHRFWSKKVVFGLSLDLRYITAFFSKR